MTPLRQALQAGQPQDWDALFDALEQQQAHWQESFQALQQQREDDSLRACGQRLHQQFELALARAELCQQQPTPQRGEALAAALEALEPMLAEAHEQIWSHHGPTPLAGVNQLFYSFEAWQGGAPESPYRAALQAETHRLAAARQMPGLAPEQDALLQDMSETLTRLAHQPDDDLMDLLEDQANRYADLLQPTDPPAPWWTRLAQAAEPERSELIEAQLARLEAVARTAAALAGATPSASLSESLEDLEDASAECQDELRAVGEGGPVVPARLARLQLELDACQAELEAALARLAQCTCVRCALPQPAGATRCLRCHARLPQSGDAVPASVDIEQPALPVSCDPALNPNLAHLRSVLHSNDPAALQQEQQRWQALLQQGRRLDPGRPEWEELQLILQQLAQPQPPLDQLEQLLLRITAASPPSQPEAPTARTPKQPGAKRKELP